MLDPRVARASGDSAGAGLDDPAGRGNDAGGCAGTAGLALCGAACICVRDQQVRSQTLLKKNISVMPLVC